MTFSPSRRAFSWSRIWARLPLVCALIAIGLATWVAFRISALPETTTLVGLERQGKGQHRLQREWSIWLAQGQPHTQSTFRTQNLVVDHQITNDNETFFSCAGTPIDNVDLWGGGAHTSRVEIDMTATHCTIKGIVAGNEGDVLWLWNGGGGTGIPFTVTLQNAASSIAVNDIYIANGKSLNIPNNDGVTLIYDGGFGWTVVGGATSTIRAAEFSYDPNAVPAALTSGSSYNDYDPWAGGSVTSFVKQNVTGSGTATLTGLVAAVAPNSDGRVVVIKNTSGSGTIAFACKNGGSTPDDQFACPNGSAFSIAHDEAATLLYDDTVNFYTLLALGKAPAAAGGTGTVTSVGSGSGISGGPITTTGNLAIDPTYTQRRVSGTCTTPNALVSINQDGTVSCSTGTGTVTSVGSGSGISGGPITSTGNLAIDPTYTQRRVSGTCAAPNAIATINQDGTVVCTAATPSMSITNATVVAGVNLSTTGTGQFDWLFASPNQQGNSTRIYDSFAATMEAKLTGGGLLLSPGIDVIGNTGTNASSNGTITFTSTAADTTTQSAISSASGNGITSAGVNAGFRFVAPVTTIQRVFRVYNSHSNSTWACTAHLMDGSVTDKVTTNSVATTAVEEIQTITVVAGSNTNLIVDCIISATSGTAVIKWYAEILSAS